MKKLLIVNKFYSPDIGGIETVAKQYADSANDAGYDVTVLCINSSPSLKSKEEVINGVNVVRCSSMGTFYSLPISIQFLYKFWMLARQADIIHGHYPFPLFDIAACFINKSKPLLLTWHSEIVRQKLLKRFFIPFTRKMLGNADMISVTSEVLYQESELLRRVPERSIKVLPLSVQYPPLPVPSSISIRDFKGRSIPNNFYLFIGRICYYKGVDVLIKAILNDPELRNYPVVISGKGDVISWVKEMVIEHKLDNVYVISGFVTEVEKQYLLKNASTLVFPSVATSEAFGIVQLEALAHGTPVINSSLKTGVPWVSLAGLTGETIAVGDYEELAKSIRKLSNDRHLREQYSKNATQRVEKMFSNDVVFKKYIEILDELCVIAQ